MIHTYLLDMGNPFLITSCFSELRLKHLNFLFLYLIIFSFYIFTILGVAQTIVTII